jgi:hypothetical protein
MDVDTYEKLGDDHEIVVLRPDTEPQALATADLAARRELPERPVIGLIDNGKPGARELLSVLAEELGKRVGRGADAVLVSKPSASYPIPDDEAAQLASRCDVVVAGLGDCGACSSCSVHDAVKIEIAGTPATVLITEPFQAIVASNAAKLGMPGYHVLTVPHPVWGKDDDELRALALQIVDAAISQVTSAGEAADPAHARVAEASGR